MYNLIILGSGRSGTSMIAGAFRRAGYYMGERLYGEGPGNPKGYFEDEEINLLNEEILTRFLPRRRGGRLGAWGTWFFRRRPGRGQKWLARLPIDKTVNCSDAINDRIRRLCAHEPFCFKDPRFSYTLPCWLPFLKRTRFVVVFRHPAETTKSILKECRSQEHLKSLVITRDEILQVWHLMYSHILKNFHADGSWLFLHYGQVLTPEGLDLLESFAEAPVDRLFPDKSLRRSVADEPVPAEAISLYMRLCDLANYGDPSGHRSGVDQRA